LKAFCQLKVGFAQKYVAEKILDSGEKSCKVRAKKMLISNSFEKRGQVKKTDRKLVGKLLRLSSAKTGVMCI